jgi:hypothetical protein
MVNGLIDCQLPIVKPNSLVRKFPLNFEQWNTGCWENQI